MNAPTDVASVARRPARRQSRLASLAIMVVTAAAILVVAYLANQPSAASGVTAVDTDWGATGPAPIVGNPAPDFTAAAADGSIVRLSDFIGKPVWVTFGASWCQPCRAENPDIQAAYERSQDRDLVVIGVFMSEDAAAVTEYTDRVGLTYLKVPDPDTRLSSEYRILGIPSHFFIDRTGVLRQMKVGTLDAATMDAVLTEISG